jgi:hypothetical protein
MVLRAFLLAKTNDQAPNLAVQRDGPCLVALPEEGDLSTRLAVRALQIGPILQVAPSQVLDIGHAPPGGIEETQEHMIAEIFLISKNGPEIGFR